jgi:hypothetical protein
MTWFKVDDKLHSHRKVAALGDDVGALALWTIAGSWCADHLTDGFVPAYMVQRFLPLSRAKANRMVSALVSVGLWEPFTKEVDGKSEEGWLFHGWNETGRQPSSAQVLADREANAARQAAFRERKKSERNAVTNAVSNGGRNRTPTRPDPTTTSYGSSDSSSAEPMDTGDEGANRPPKPRPPVTEPAAFDRFYRAFPRHVGPAAAEKAWNRALAEGADPQVLIDCAALYAMERKMQDPKFTKHPATWLNQRCWEDEPDPAYVAPPVVANGNGHARNGNDYGSDAHLNRYLERAAAREATGGGW